MLSNILTQLCHYQHNLSKNHMKYGDSGANYSEKSFITLAPGVRETSGGHTEISASRSKFYQSQKHKKWH
jgi:hypothetical protein